MHIANLLTCGRLQLLSGSQNYPTIIIVVILHKNILQCITFESREAPRLVRCDWRSIKKKNNGKIIFLNNDNCNELLLKIDNDNFLFKKKNNFPFPDIFYIYILHSLHLQFYIKYIDLKQS